MALFRWMNKQISHYRWYDISCIKISVMAFTLLLVKFFPVLLSLDAIWYALIGLGVALVPLRWAWRVKEE